MALADLAIVGGGATGLAAAVHATAAGLSTLVLERSIPGGGLLELPRVQTLPGHPVGLSGPELVERSVAQAERYGAEIRTGADVVGLQPGGTGRVLELEDGGTFTARAVIVATGTELPDLPVPGLRELVGSGVHFGVPRSAPVALWGRDVFLAGELGAIARPGLHLSRCSRSVTLLPYDGRHRPRPRADLLHRIRTTRNVSVRPGREVIEVAGVDHLETLTLRGSRTGRTTVWTASALFLLELDNPRTGWLAGSLSLDVRGALLTGRRLEVRAPAAWPLTRAPFPHETSIPGVFAAGGARRGPAWCPASSIEEGIGAARESYEYLRGLAARTRRGLDPLTINRGR